MSLARELISVNDPLPLEILIESANVDSPEKYDWDLFDQLIDRFPETGLAKLGKGYKLSKEGDIDQAFDLFSVSSINIKKSEENKKVFTLYYRKDWRNVLIVSLVMSV